MLQHTPVEKYNGIWVKREDLCCPAPGPSFSKMRGVLAHMQNRPEKTIGVLDTYHSKAGWAVAWAGQALGKEVIDFWPRYKADPVGRAPRIQQLNAESMGAQLVELQAGRSAILFHRANAWMRQHYPLGYMMPNALKLPESVTENAAEARWTIEQGLLPESGNLVISISSGTVAAGVLKGFKDAGVLKNYRVYLHQGYSRSQEAVLKYIETVSGVAYDDCSHGIALIDEGYNYADASDFIVPFPCNKFYDAKAWAWMIKELESDHPMHSVINNKVSTIFWSIGD